jgi:hypothetical protein
MRHYHQLGLSVVLAAALCAMGPPHSTADTTYTYTGNPFTTAVSPYTTNDFISGSFDLATPLGSNVPLSTISPLSFSFSDGVQTLTNATPSILRTFTIQTDATATLAHWIVELFFPVSTQPPFALISTANLTPAQAPRMASQVIAPSFQNRAAFAPRLT